MMIVTIRGNALELSEAEARSLVDQLNSKLGINNF